MPRGMHPNSLKALEQHRKTLCGESAVKAAQKTHEVRRQKRTFREEFEAELQKAIKGDLRAIELIRDTIGEKPAENIVLFEAEPAVITEIETMVYESP